MRAIRIIILVAGMAVLLAGCRSGCDQDGISPPEDTSLGRVIDSPAGLPLTPSQRGKDSIREYYERMELWEALHEGMSEMEGFK